jgi:AraC-like DNA-binding protein
MSRSRSRPVESRLLKLDDVAERLGCHIETLRLRIRSGRLKAVRGPHGAYFISGRAMAGLRLRKPPERIRRRPTTVDRETAWEITVKRMRRQARAFDELLPFLRALKARHSLNPRAYRLLCAHGLRELDFDAVIIARELGISVRHARRVIRQDLAEAVTRAAHRWAQIEAQRLVGEIRAGLKAEGFRFHQWVMRGRRAAGPPTHPERPRPAFKVKTLTGDEKTSLRKAGLADEQIWAIGIAGLGADELNRLLLGGFQSGGPVAK